MGGCLGIKSSTVDLDGPVSIAHFETERVIGKGGFGKVNAVRMKGTKEKTWYAMKALAKDHIVKTKSWKEVFVERDILANLKDPRICNSYFAFQDDQFLYLVMDLALGGDLRYQLMNTPNKQAFTEPQTRIYISQIVLALEYCHAKNLIHRDLKPDNMLMDAKGWIKLTDFGISRYLNNDGVCTSSSGTHGYMPPEIYKKSHKHGKAFDWFALAVVAVELLTKNRPYTEVEIRSYLSEKKTTKDPFSGMKTVSAECKSFLKGMLALNEEERLGYKGTDEVKNHPWFQHKSFSFDAIVDGSASPPFVPDTSKMNAAPDADIQDFFLNKEQKTVIAPEDQKKFEGYEYDYRNEKENSANGSLVRFDSNEVIKKESENNGDDKKEATNQESEMPESTSKDDGKAIENLEEQKEQP